MKAERFGKALLLKLIENIFRMGRNPVSLDCSSDLLESHLSLALSFDADLLRDTLKFREI